MLSSLKVSALQQQRVGFTALHLGEISVRIMILKTSSEHESKLKKFPKTLEAVNMLSQTTSDPHPMQHSATCVVLSKNPTIEQLQYLKENNLLMMAHPEDYQMVLPKSGDDVNRGDDTVDSFFKILSATAMKANGSHGPIISYLGMPSTAFTNITTTTTAPCSICIAPTSLTFSPFSFVFSLCLYLFSFRN